MRWSRAIPATLACLALAGCGVSVQQAASDYGPPYCKLLQSCFPDGFTQTWPGGVDECEQQWTNGDSNQDLSKSSGCSQSQLNTCVNDVKTLSCGDSVSDTPLPASCAVCYGPASS